MREYVKYSEYGIQQTASDLTDKIIRSVADVFMDEALKATAILRP